MTERFPATPAETRKLLTVYLRQARRLRVSIWSAEKEHEKNRQQAQRMRLDIRQKADDTRSTPTDFKLSHLACSMDTMQQVLGNERRKLAELEAIIDRLEIHLHTLKRIRRARKP